jgi:hypothetical protein
MLRRLPILVLLVAAQAARAQVQDVTFANQVVVNSTTPIALATLALPIGSLADVALTAHVYLEGAGFDYDSYVISICKDSASGSEVGVAVWTPGDKTPASGVFEADTLLVTGFERNVTLPATYVVCARKANATSPDVTASVRGFDAEVAPAGTSLAGLEAHGLVEVQVIGSTSWTGLATLSVDAGAGSDLLLTAHVVVSGLGLGGGTRYQFGICKETAGGTLVGETIWRPQLTASAGATSGDTISLTGFDAGVSGTVHYVLCARKYDSLAPTISATELGIHAVRKPAGIAAYGVEAIGFPTSATLDSTSFASAASIGVDAVTAPYDVRLTAHAHLEGTGFDANSIYEIGICRGFAGGPMVGRTFWRPVHQTTDGNYIADTIALTGYDGNQAGLTSYVLCARQFGSAIPTVTIYDTGLVATVPEPAATALAFTSLGLLAALRVRLRHFAST